jgi:hypothetical protein
MKPSPWHYAEAQEILDHWRTYPWSLVELAIRFTHQWVIK